jgi:putative ABC transport system permease protein
MKTILNQFFRNLIKNKLNFSITILGFSISIAVVIVLVFFIIQEKSYDKAYENIDNIYMIVTKKNEPFVEEDAKEILTNKYPQIKSACRYHNYKTDFVYNQDFFEGQLITTDEGFFDVFSVHFIKGSKETAFSDIQGMVITESYSKKLFENDFSIGKIIKTPYGKVFQVTGVIKDLPTNSSISADCFIHYKSKITSSGINNVSTTKLFIVLQAETIVEDIEKKISETLVKSSKILNNIVFVFGETIEWKLRPFNTAYFDTSIKNDHLQHANIRLIKVTTVISFIILILAIINYINLKTTESISRIKEIGIRKINGANAKNIVRQFLLESIITCLIATILAFLFTMLITPVFAQILGKNVEFIEFTYINIFFIILFIFILGLVSGLLPALLASKYSPIQLFQSKNKVLFKSISFRNALNTFQFTISIILIICLFIILKQIKHIQNKDVGFENSHLINIAYPVNAQNNNVIRNYLKQNRNILSVSFSKGSPMYIGSYSGSGTPIESVGTMSTDNKFIETFKLNLLQGRNINYPSKIKECLITENAYQESGWTNLENKIYKDHKVVGVVNTFNCDDLHVAARNLMITNSSDNFSSVNIRISPNDISQSVDYIKQTWETLLPEFGFRYSFYDDWIENSLSKERNHVLIAFVFGFLSIILCCLGLFGLANYSISHRTKEIGIRKINGASVFEILRLLNIGFLKWIIIAFIIACPIAIFLLNKWLNNFASKTTLDWWIFLLSVLIVCVISLLTISGKSWSAANRNPVDTLRYE